MSARRFSAGPVPIRAGTNSPRSRRTLAHSMSSPRCEALRNPSWTAIPSTRRLSIRSSAASAPTACARPARPALLFGDGGPGGRLAPGLLAGGLLAGAPWLFARLQHAAAAIRGTAPAGKDFVDVGRIVRIAPDGVVVAQLLARLDGANRLDEHAPLADGALAIRIAAMVDESRLIAVAAGVDDQPGVDREQERVI